MLREAKVGKDRVVMLPRSSHEVLTSQVVQARAAALEVQPLRESKVVYRLNDQSLGLDADGLVAALRRRAV